MSWAKLDDAILDNGKIAQAGTLGLLLHVAGITWCARNLTDGRIPKAKVSCLLNLCGIYVDRGNDSGCAPGCPPGCPPGSPAQVSGVSIDHPDADGIALHLSSVGLWHDRGEEWELHDYLKYNPSREEVLAKRQHAREKKQRQRSDSDVRPAGSPPACPPGTLRGSPDAVPIPPVPVPVPLQKEKDTESRRGRRLPSDFVLTTERRAMALAKGLPATRHQEEFEKFTDHFHALPGARGRKVDWDATWRNWCAHAVEWAGNGKRGIKAEPKYDDGAVARLKAEQAELLRRDHG